MPRAPCATCSACDGRNCAGAAFRSKRGSALRRRSRSSDPDRPRRRHRRRRPPGNRGSGVPRCTFSSEARQSDRAESRPLDSRRDGASNGWCGDAARARVWLSSALKEAEMLSPSNDTIRLPLSPEQRPPAPRPSSADRSSSNERPGARVLLVENHSTVRHALRDLLGADLMACSRGRCSQSDLRARRSGAPQPGRRHRRRLRGVA